MKILHIIDSGGLYGAEMMILNLSHEQIRLGHQPIIASIGEQGLAEKPIEIEARRRGVPVVPFRMRAGPNLIGAFRIMKFARTEGVEILHSHGYKPNILFGLIPKTIRKLPMVATVHGWTWTGERSRMMIYEWLDAFALRFIDRVVLVDEAMKDHPKLQGRPRLRLDVVVNGIAVNTHAENADLDAGIVAFCRGGKTVGAIGRLSREKGFDQLVEAVSILVRNGHDIRLVIMGEGSLRDKMKSMVKELGLESRVLMPGYVKNAANYLPFFKIFVMSSLTEGLPIVILEAMLAGVPIVSTRVGGIPEVLHHGKAGVLVPAPCALDLAEGIKRLLIDNSTATRIARSGEKIVMDRYSACAMAYNYNNVYKSLLSNRVN